MTTLGAPPGAERDGVSAVLATARAFTRAELIGMFSRSTLDHAVQSGLAVRLLPSVYAGALHASAFDVRAHAALKWAGEDAVIGGRSALFVWGLLNVPPSPIELALPHGHRLKAPPWLRVRRCTTTIAGTERGLLRVATPAFAIVHGYGDLPPGDRAAVVYRAVQLRLVTARQLQAALKVTPRVKARRSLERRVSMAADGVESFLEERSLSEVFNTKEFARFVRQHDLVHEGRAFRIDAFDRASLTAVELDGGQHGEPTQRLRDIERDAVLATLGILTVRFSYRDITERPDWCRWTIRQVLARRTHRSANA